MHIVKETIDKFDINIEKHVHEKRMIFLPILLIFNTKKFRIFGRKGSKLRKLKVERENYQMFKVCYITEIILGA